MTRLIDQTGNRSGSLTVVRVAIRGEDYPQEQTPGRARWVCKCDCGAEITVQAGELRNGRAGSCGKDGKCFKAFKDGRTKHYLLGTWHQMKRRCENEPNYAGRGISVDPEWAEDPWSFFNWVDQNLGLRPDGHTLDRVDNDGNYEPGNLRWASVESQNNNRRTVAQLEAENARLRAMLARN